MLDDRTVKVHNLPTPDLDRRGQQIFWDRQAVDYETADMTNDNAGELDLVKELSKQYCCKRYKTNDVVTFGGAVGCRDPKVVLDVLELYGCRPDRVCFNDLSGPMTKRAVETHLQPYAVQNACVALPGSIHEVASQIEPAPRRIIIGVYRVEAFVSPNPHYGYECDGLTEYHQNESRLGTHFIIEPVCLSGDGYIVREQRLVTYWEEKAGDAAANFVARAREKGFDAIRVVGCRPGQAGFFLSHWYTEAGRGNG